MAHLVKPYVHYQTSDPLDQALWAAVGPANTSGFCPMEYDPVHDV